MTSDASVSILRIGLIERPSAVMTASVSLPAAASASISRSRVSRSLPVRCASRRRRSRRQAPTRFLAAAPRRSQGEGENHRSAESAAASTQTSPIANGRAASSWPRPHRRDDRGPRRLRRASPRRFENAVVALGGNFSLIFRVNVTQHVERGEQRVAGFPGAEYERASKSGTMRRTVGYRSTISPRLVVARPRGRFCRLRPPGFSGVPSRARVRRPRPDPSRKPWRPTWLSPCRAAPASMRRASWPIDDMFLVFLIGAPEHAASILSNIVSAASVRTASISRANTTSVASGGRIETRKMLGAQNRGFPSDCRVARAVNTLFPIRADAEIRMVRSARQSRRGSSELALRPLAHPCERRMAIFAHLDEQCQSLCLLMTEIACQCLVGLLARPRTSGQGKAFQFQR